PQRVSLMSSELASSRLLLLVKSADEVLQAECTDDVQVIIQYFKQDAVFSAYAVEDHAPFVSCTLLMRIPRRAGGVTTDGTHLLKFPIRFIQTMLALHDQRVRQCQVAMEKDLLIGGKFEHEINDLLGHIDVEHSKYEMLEISQGVPANVAIIERIRRCHKLFLFYCSSNSS